MGFKVIVTGATGLVGEGVILECLASDKVSEVLMVNRRPSKMIHPKLKELIVPNFFKLDEFTEQLKDYNACFYCAGISSNGLTEADYTKITFDTTLHFANVLVKHNPKMIFCHVSGSHTDSTEKGRVMWARVKGKAENELMKLPFAKVYNFRPGAMKPTRGQKNVKGYYKIISALFPVFRLLFPNNTCTVAKVGQAMINSVFKGYPKQILEVKDIKLLAENQL